MTGPRPPMPGERLFTMLLLAASLVLLYLAWGISGFSAVSSPGVFPMVAAAVMVASLASVAIRNFRAGPGAAGSMIAALAAFRRRVVPPVLVVTVGLMAVLMAAIEPLGFVPAAGGFLFAAILYLQGGRPLRAALVTVVAVAVVYAVFRLVFRVVLPEMEWL